MSISCLMEWTFRPYTPISSPDQTGSLTLMIKEYSVRFSRSFRM